MNIENGFASLGTYLGERGCAKDYDISCKICATVCQHIFRRGIEETMTESIYNADVPRSERDSKTVTFESELKDFGYMGHPIIIEFLLLPASGIGSNNLGLACKRIPAFLVEQWMIQFLPKRLITGTYVDLSTLSSEISLHCAMSILNKIIFGDKSCRVASKAKSLRCVCRLTNLRDANVFSSCWFSLNASELDDKKSHFISTDFGFYLIRDFYDALSLPDDVHTTTRMKRPKRTYLCSSPCSHTHRQDTAEICTSRTFSRISASSEEFLDISVTSILEVPTTAPTELNLSSLRYLYNGTMSLPNKRMHEVVPHTGIGRKSIDNSWENKFPKSPVVIMSLWNKATSLIESPPCKQKRLHQGAGLCVDDCISEFTSLSMQNQTCAMRFTSQDTKKERNDVRTQRLQKYQESKCTNAFAEFPFSTSAHFNPRTRLPLQSSPVPIKRQDSTSFDYDDSMANSSPGKKPGSSASSTPRPTTLALKGRPSKRESTAASSPSSSSYCPFATTSPSWFHSVPGGFWGSNGMLPGTPSPSSSSQQLLINFEESMLNGRIPPAGMVDGFTLEIGASGSFFPPHVKLPVVAYFFQLSDDDKTPSPYLGHVDLTGLSNKRGYHVPRKGSIQLTLFNPSDCVMKVFVIQYNLEDMPPNSQTFLRQRTVYMPVSPSERTSVESESAKLPSDLVSCVFNGKISEPQRLKLPAVGTGGESLPVFLRYLVHLRFHTTKSSNLYLHTDIRLIFARNTFEFDPRVAAYRMRSFLDGPTNPRFSPKAC
uniref:DUF4210 domain-containing protein n=1 Tax=Mesocestoides corti TaxID=53468 RepID=A0A5K3FFA7_MESCO